MKKLASLFVGLSLVAGVASAAGVTSVNMVGYQNVTVPSSGLVMMAVNWNAVGGSDLMSINPGITANGLVAGDDGSNSDLLYVWDVTMNAGAGGYRIYYLWNGDLKWYEVANDVYGAATNQISRGQGFWLKHIAASTNITVSGEVPVNATNSVVFGAGKLNMFGSAYTADIVINGANQIWAGNAGDDGSNSDLIYVWDISMNGGLGGYRIFYLWNGDTKWYEVANDVYGAATNSIMMGNGAWFKNYGPSSTVWTEIRPYTP